MQEPIETIGSNFIFEKYLRINSNESNKLGYSCLENGGAGGLKHSYKMILFNTGD